MTDRNWMKIHSGLNTPEHRQAIGIRIWLFMDMIDHVDWETGIVWGWKDEEAAERLDMPLKTLRTQRKELKEAGYIQLFHGDQCQHIMILRWRNPRLVNPPQINVPEEDYNDWGCPKVATPSTPVLGTPPSRKAATPTIEDHSESQLSSVAAAPESDEKPEPETTTAANIFTVWEEEAKTTISSFLRDELGDMVDTFGFDLAADAIREAVKSTGPGQFNIKYVWRILERWQREGKRERKSAQPVHEPTNPTRRELPLNTAVQATGPEIEAIFDNARKQLAEKQAKAATS